MRYNNAKLEANHTPALIFCSSRTKQEKKNYTTYVIAPLSQVTRLHLACATSR